MKFLGGMALEAAKSRVSAVGPEGRVGAFGSSGPRATGVGETGLSGSPGGGRFVSRSAPDENSGVGEDARRERGYAHSPWEQQQSSPSVNIFCTYNSTYLRRFPATSRTDAPSFRYPQHPSYAFSAIHRTACTKHALDATRMAGRLLRIVCRVSTLRRRCVLEVGNGGREGGSGGEVSSLSK